MRTGGACRVLLKPLRPIVYPRDDSEEYHSSGTGSYLLQGKNGVLHYEFYNEGRGR
jgi:hypothetical protein